MQGDAFAELARLAEAGRRFELVVLDPPALAHAKDDVPGALHAYARLAELGARLLAPRRAGRASCSARVDADALAEPSGRAPGGLRWSKRSAHAVDHPISFPEAAYLKCLFLRARAS